MKRTLTVWLILGISIIVIHSSTYTLPEHKQALIFHLEIAKSKPVKKAGLHFKIPILQRVQFFEKRVLKWDGPPSEIPTSEKTFIWVDTTARWEIESPLKFYQTVNNTANALDRIGALINGSTKDWVSRNRLIESVRNSNNLFEDIEKKKSQLSGRSLSIASEAMLDEFVTSVEKISVGREELSNLIAKGARSELAKLGIKLVDVQLRGIAYQKSVEEKVYESMREERKQIASKVISSGKGEVARILGQLDLAKKEIESVAYRDSQNIKGQAEAKANEIYAQAYGADRDFFEFQQTLETYKSLSGPMFLSTGINFFKFLEKGMLPPTGSTLKKLKD